MRGTLTGQRYVDDILRPHVGLFLNDLPGAIFQQDNARTHTARGAQDFLRRFQTVPWPARFPRFVPCRAPTRGLLATDHVIFNHGQVTWTTPELAPPLLTTTPHQREDVSALDRFSVHLCPTRRVFSGTGLELVTKPATIRCLYHSATAAVNSMPDRVAECIAAGGGPTRY
ncbi:uncharacterized protein TNCV_1080671 [Trichonephila clavipes]|uniref:Uncharacterized protein n=1 Tax=Trichonephila clavipes TaxID=2585209 RepID=A0A8X6V9J4_TRICX|nr:uncharacterized protein TNCV_1080671 [Trichonephila clavipes]